MTGVSTLKTLLKSRIKHSPLSPLFLPRRRFHAYCLGPPKTGTTSIAEMLRRDYRSEHQPLRARTTEIVLATYAGSMTRAELIRALKWRDRELHLEMESSHPLTVAAGLLAEAFPAARFVLTVREPRAWVDSSINMLLNKPPQYELFRELMELDYGRRYPEHPPEERSLAERGLFTLDGYLSGWAEFYRQILEQVPAERLLVLKLRELSQRPERLADFLGIPVETLDLAASHANQAPKRHGILDELPPGYVEEKIEHHCRPVLEALADRL